MQVEYKTEKGTGLFVEVPSSSNNFTLEHGRLCFNDEDNTPNYIILNKYGINPEKGQDDDDFWEDAANWQHEQNNINKLKLIGISSELNQKDYYDLGFFEKISNIKSIIDVKKKYIVLFKTN